MDDTTVEAIRAAILKALRVDPGMGGPLEPVWETYRPEGVAIVLAEAVAAALPDPRPTEAEVMMGYGLTPYQRESLRALGCFRACEPPTDSIHTGP